MVVSWRKTYVPFFDEKGEKNLEEKMNMKMKFEHERR